MKAKRNGVLNIGFRRKIYIISIYICSKINIINEFSQINYLYILCIPNDKSE